VAFKNFTHISPSSLKKFEKQPNTFFMEKILDPGWQRDEQGLPAAIGTVFDIFVKLWLISEYNKDLLSIFKNRINCSEDKNIFNYLIDNNITNKEYKAKALQEGALIYAYYKETLLKNNIVPDFYDIELLNQVYLPNNIGNLQTIPTFCKGDACLNNHVKKDNLNHLEPLPLDWKVIGSGSKASPRKYYQAIFDDLGNYKGPYKGYYKHIPFQDIDEDWATQLVFTGWQCGKPTYPEEMFPYLGYIHCLVCDTYSGNIRLAIYEGELSIYWQQRVLQRCRNMWNAIQSGEFYNKYKYVTLTSMMALMETWW
jgi:hypothetical protein